MKKEYNPKHKITGEETVTTKPQNRRENTTHEKACCTYHGYGHDPLTRSMRRRIFQCHIEFSEKTTLFVGANNSGKTSAMDALGKFLADRNFTFNDITISERSAINVIGERWIQKDCEEPTTITEWESLMPKMDIWLNVASNEMHYSNIKMARRKIRC